jgi:hypothetical protein
MVPLRSEFPLYLVSWATWSIPSNNACASALILLRLSLSMTAGGGEDG